MSAYTFICLADTQIATFVDPQAIDELAVRAHAFGLLREHASAASVEVWKDEGLVMVIDRDGIRSLPLGAQSGPGAEQT